MTLALCSNNSHKPLMFTCFAPRCMCPTKKHELMETCSTGALSCTSSDTCGDNARCRGRTCQCDDGYESIAGTGAHCTAQNPCKAGTCSKGQMCFDYNDGINAWCGTPSSNCPEHSSYYGGELVALGGVLCASLLMRAKS